MNEGRRHRRITAAFSRPTPTAVPMAASIATGSGRPAWSRPTPSMPLASARTDPIDRSIAPTMSTNVMPTAAMSRAGTW